MGGFRLQGQYPAPGTIVSVQAFVLFRHTGIVCDRMWNGAPLVVANSFRHGGVKEVSWDDFTQGQEWGIDGYPSALPPHIVLARARSKLGETYSPFSFNCEHFTQFCHGLVVESGQLAAVLLAALVVGAAIASRKK